MSNPFAGNAAPTAPQFQAPAQGQPQQAQPDWQQQVAQAAAPQVSPPAFQQVAQAAAPPVQQFAAQQTAQPQQWAAPAAAPAPAAGPAAFQPNFGAPAGGPAQFAPTAPPTFQAAPETQQVVPGMLDPAPAQAQFTAAQSSFAGPDDGDPFAEPAGPGSGLRMRDVLGMLCLVKPTEHIPHIKTSKSEGQAVRADFVILDHPQQPGAVAANTMVFQRALVRDLLRIIDQGKPYLLGRLTMGNASNGNNAPYIFAPPSEQDKATARSWLSQNRL